MFQFLPMETISYYFYYLDAHFHGFPPIVRITVLLIMLLSCLYFISFSRIVIDAYRLRQQNLRRSKTKGKYEAQLERILFSKDDMSSSEIQQHLNMSGEKLKGWEKVYITELVVTMIQDKP